MDAHNWMATTRAFGRRAMLVTVLALIAVGAPRLAQAEDGTANQAFVITVHNIDGTGRVVASGPISGVGEYRLLSHVDNPDGTSTDMDEFDLPDGKVLFSDTYTVQIRQDGQSCTWLIKAEGTYTLTGGTQAFTGAVGSGTFTASGVFVAGRDEAGECVGLDSRPVAFSEVVRGAGTTLAGTVA